MYVCKRSISSQYDYRQSEIDVSIGDVISYSRKKQHLLYGTTPDMSAGCSTRTFEPNSVLLLQRKNFTYWVLHRIKVIFLSNMMILEASRVRFLPNGIKF